MAQTLTGAVITALLTAWRADVTLLGYGGRLRIFDGPPTTDRAAEIELWVGATGSEDEEEVISFEQAVAVFDGDRDEQVDIQNVVWVYATDNSLASARSTALAVFAAAAAVVRAGTLGVSGLFTLDVTRGSLLQGQYPTGPGVRLLFTVHATGTV